MLDPLKNCLEVRIAYLEGIVIGLECRVRVEVEDKRVVHPDGRKVRKRRLVLQPEDAREKPSGRLVVLRRDDRVVEHYWHGDVP